ncbi:hypothetical protein [Halodesulfovibrio spirochaetisodalis]|uniref:Uncharacterized protein n=1 Tax=Halodesulfovibrio spirochaetisodalis TaxID=1560234 RepID=A0A1B7XA42_9BACT|nr:hypothetical protein [Halodesulfovibrio spirochaetisodalis]OBQ46207.1 hypothetical protein SP90_13480 [Halodesulfovibrio spirochaetisodalis]
MVKIPGTSYSRSQISYSPTATLEDVSVQGQNVATLGRMVADIAQKEQVRQDNESFLEAKTKYDNWNLEFDTQAAQRVGSDAGGLTQDYQKAESQQVQTLGAGLSKRALNALQQYTTGQRAQRVKAHAGFEHQQRIVVAQDKYGATMKTFQQKMQAAPENIAAHDAEARQIFDLAVSSGALRSSQKEAYMADYAGMKQNAWKALYERAPEQALKRFAEFGITDSTKAVYAEKFKDTETTKQSITLANELSGNGKSLKENLDYVHTTYADNPLLHDKLVARLKMRGAEETASVVAAKKAQKEELVAQVRAVEVDPENRGAASEELASIIEGAPPELKKELTAQASEILNPSGLTDLEKLAQVEQAVLKKDIRSVEELQTHYAGISRNHQRKLEETLRKVGKGEVPKLTVDKVNRVLAELGYNKKMNNPKQMKEYNALHAAYTAFYEQRNPQNLKEEMATNLAFKKQMEQEGVIPGGSWYGGDKGVTRAEAIAAGNLAEFMPEVDEANRGKLQVTTRALGVDMKNTKLLREHNKAWLPVYERMDEADLKKVISVMLREKIAVSPASAQQVYKLLTEKKG